MPEPREPRYMRPLPDRPPVPAPPPKDPWPVRAVLGADALVGVLNPISHVPPRLRQTLRIPEWAASGPFSNAVRLVDAIHQAKAQQIAENEARPRRIAEEAYGAGIRARIERRGPVQYNSDDRKFR